MTRLLLWFIGLFGFIFTPDNHVTPVIRLGRYNRTKSPGLSWINPIFERPLAPVKTGINVGNFYFDEMLSCDNIPFTIQITVLFSFKPQSAVKEAAAQLVKADENLLKMIVRDYTNQGLRRLVVRYGSEALSNHITMTMIEKNLGAYLTATLRPLGLAPLKQNGILIKEVIAPAQFKHTMFDVKHDESILEVLRSYPVPELIKLLNEVILANGLKHGPEILTMMLGGPEGIHSLPLVTSRQARQNGHS